MKRLSVLCVSGLVIFASFTAISLVVPVANAFADSSCSVSGTTANVTLDQPAPGVATILSQDASHNLTVSGTGCGTLTGAGSLTAIDLAVTSGAPSQLVILNQGAAGGVFPCTALIEGSFRSQDSLEVLGGTGENLSLGDISSGTGVNLNSCGAVGTVTGIGSYVLLGSGSATLSAGGGTGFSTALSIPATFIVGASSESLVAGSSADTVDFSNVATSPSTQLVVNASGGSFNLQADGTAVVGPTTYTFTTGRSNFTTFIGSSSGSTQFEAGGTPGYTFNGQGSGNTLDLSAATSGVAVDLSGGTSGTVCEVATPCPSGQSDGISGLTTVTGSSAGGNSFVGGSSTYSFVGPGNGNTFAVGSGQVQVTDPGFGNTVDFSNLSAPLSVNVSGAMVGSVPNDAAMSGSTTYTFGSMPTTFVGSAGTTTFFAGSTADTYTGVPSAATTLSYADTPGSPLGVCVVVGPGCTTAGTVLFGATTEPFTGIDTFVGLPGGNTSFTAGAVGGLAFDASGSGNVLDLSGDTRSVTANFETGDVLVAPGQHDTFSGIPAVVGSSVGSNDFIAGAASESFSDNGSAAGDTVDFSNVATSPSTQLVVNASGSSINSQADGTAVVGPTTYTFTTGRSNFTSFIGSSSGSTQFEAGGTPGYILIGQGSGNTLDLSTAPSGVAVDLSGGTSGTVCVVATPCPSDQSDGIEGLTTITGSSAGGNSFVGGSSTYSFVGPGNGNRFVVGSGPMSVTDPGFGNTVDFSHLSTPLTVNVSGAMVGSVPNDAATSGSTTYIFGNMPTTLVGSAGTTTFFAGPTGDTYKGVPSAATTLSYADTPGSPLGVCVVVGPGCTTAGTALLGATTEPFTGIDTFVGLPSGNTSFTAGAAGGLAFDGLGLGNVLDLSGVPAATTVKVNGDSQASPGAITRLSAATHDSFFGIQMLLGKVTIQSVVTTLPSSLPVARIKKAYSQQLTGTGGAGSYVDWRIQNGALPSGLTLSTSGLLAGTPTRSGKFTFEVGLESAGIPGGHTYVLTVAPFPPSVTSISPTHGRSRGGTVVTVRGTNLTGAVTVLFGTKHGTHVVVVSSKELKVTAPRGHGTVNVRVVTAGGTSPRITKDKFRYT
jgi:hypothetical protein